MTAFAQKYGGHFSPKRFASPLPSDDSASIPNKEENDTGMQSDICQEQECSDLTPTAENPRVFLQEQAALTAEPESKLKQSPLCIYFRLFKSAGYHGDDEIFRAVYLQERTAGSLIRGICEKCPIDGARVIELQFVGAGGIASDEVLRNMPHGQALDVEFMEVRTDFISKNVAVNEVKMLLHI